MISLICSVMIYIAHEGSVELNLKGTLVKETETHYVGDFSEDVKKFLIIGSARTYSRVSVEKSKCWRFEE